MVKREKEDGKKDDKCDVNRHKQGRNKEKRKAREGKDEIKRKKKRKRKGGREELGGRDRKGMKDRGRVGDDKERREGELEIKEGIKVGDRK